MNLKVANDNAWSFHNQDGKGMTGCFVMLVLVAILVFVGFRVGPDYYACREFESDLKSEASKAGATFADDDTIIRNILALAKKNEIKLSQENVKIERFGQQMRIRVQYPIQFDLIVYSTTMDCTAEASTYVGRL